MLYTQNTVKTEHHIIDNALSPRDASIIRDTLLSNEFSWHYADVLSYDKECDAEHFKKEFSALVKDGRKAPEKPLGYFTHMFFKDYMITSNLFQIIVPIINMLQVNALMRVKANFYTNQVKDQVMSHPSHRDHEVTHKAAIYYVNTNNGYTILEDGTKIESIANRILLFDGSTLHSSTDCSDQPYRVNINFNYF
ncbi:hypothetical protein EBR43_12250 [bacterium]|nr:hypothetical protein [bacterium]